MEKYILAFVRGSGSVWVHLSTILRVQVWFRFTEVKFCWFRFGSGSPKWNDSFGFTVRVQVRFDTLVQILSRTSVLSIGNLQSRASERGQGAMTLGPMDFGGPIKITLKGEQQSLLCKQREDVIVTLEQRSNSNRVFCKRIGFLLWGVGLAKDGPLMTS